VNRKVGDSPNFRRLGLVPASVGFLLDLIFGPEDGNDMFLRNVWALFELYDVATKKTIPFVFTDVWTSYPPTFSYDVYYTYTYK
jgi:hypothetical protein